MNATQFASQHFDAHKFPSLPSSLTDERGGGEASPIILDAVMDDSVKRNTDELLAMAGTAIKDHEVIRALVETAVMRGIRDGMRLASTLQRIVADGGKR